MSRSAWIAGALAAIATGAGGYWAGQHADTLAKRPLRAIARGLGAAGDPVVTTAPPAQSAGRPSGPVIYYRHPDGTPAYSLEPKRSESGKDFVAVRASEDLSFDEPPAQSAALAAGGNERGKRVRFYRNPMGLLDTSPTPKKDAMGMDYIPVYDGDDQDATTITLAPGRLQRTGVRSEPAIRRAIVRQVRAPGAVQIDERRITVVATRSDAFIDKVADVTTGDRVKKGEPLMRLYSAEIAAAGAQYLTDLSAGGRTLSGGRQRLENLGVPADVIVNIEKTRQPSLSIPWSAPRDGVVLERNVVEGMKATAGDVLFRLADLSTVWVVADINENDLAAVRVGAPATVRIRSLPGRTFEGQVALLYPQIAKETRTTRARIEIANPDGVLLPDMYAEVAIASSAGAPVIAVPDSAVIDSGDRRVVIVDRGDGRFEPREVDTGVRGGGLTEVRNGVEAGDKVVVSANFLIDAESNLKAALRGLANAEQAP